MGVSPRQNASAVAATLTLGARACRAMRWIISLTVVQQSASTVTRNFSAALEMAVWVTQFWVIMPQTRISSVP